MSNQISLTTSDVAINEGDFDKKLFFSNGRGVSVVRHGFSYGNTAGKFELAVLRGTSENWDLDYTTEVTDDVVGWLDAEEVVAIAEQVRDLPDAQKLIETGGVQSIE